MTISGTYFSFKSRLSVETEEPLDPTNTMMSTPFKITNEGLLAIYNVNRHIGVCDLSIQPQNIAWSSLTLEDELKEVPVLNPGESEVVKLIVPPPAPDNTIFASGDIFVTVTFKNWVGIRRRQEFRFATAKRADGQIRWYHRARSDPCERDLVR